MSINRLRSCVIHARALRGETDLRAHRSHQCVARVFVIAGYMACDFVAMVRVRVRVVEVVVVAPALRPM